MEKEKQELVENVFFKEIKYLSIIFAGIIILLKIIFIKESMANILKIGASFYYLLLLPGFSLMYYWKNDLSIMERVIIAFPVSLAILGISGYYFGLIGIQLNLFTWIAPLVIILLGICINLIKSKEIKK